MNWDKSYKSWVLFLCFLIFMMYDYKDGSQVLLMLDGIIAIMWFILAVNETFSNEK